MPTPVVWTPRLISRFWNGLADTPILERMSFARLAGPALMEFLAPWIRNGGRCLDYGGGHGHLVHLLVDAGIQTAAFEPSEARTKVVTDRLATHEKFLGSLGTYDKGVFDAVICTEVIEHIPVDETEIFVKALVRRIQAGGRLLLTTPNAEDLDAAGVYCPVCDSTFHRWQHLRAWHVRDLKELMERYGLQTEWIGLVGFDDVGAIREFHLRRRLGEEWPWCRDDPDGSRIPVIGLGDHIVYIARKGTNEMSLREPDVLLGAGLREAQRLCGGDAIAVVPSSSVKVDASTIIVMGDLLRTEGDRASGPVIDTPQRYAGTAATDKVLVFPASRDLLEEGIKQGRLPRSPLTLVFEEGQWREIRCREVPARHALEPVRKRSRLFRSIHARKERLLDRLRTNVPVRRLQPLIDHRERIVRASLLGSADFPYRMSHVVEGRVLFAIGTLGSGGAERQLINTAEGLRAHGVDDLHVLVNHLYDEPGNSFYLERAKSVAVTINASPTFDHRADPWIRNREALRDAVGDGLLSRVLNDAQVLKALSPEVVHCSLDWTNITVGMAAVLAGVPFIFLSGRNLSPAYFSFFQWFMYPCYRALAACAGVHLLNNSEAGRNDYARWLRLPPSRIGVLRNGLNYSQFPLAGDLERRQAQRQLDLADNQKVVVGAFRFSSEKRPLLWIDVAALVQREVPGTLFLLCGVGPMLQAAKDRARERGIEEHVRFLGARADIDVILAAADLVMQVSLQEGTPNALIEAQATGVPVVTTPAFGAAEAVEHGVTGRVVDDETAAGIARAAVSVLRDEAFCRSVRVEGPKFVEARFGFDRMILDTLTTYADAGAEWAAELLPASRRYRVHVPVGAAQPEQGLAWLAHLPGLDELGDSMDAPRQSRLVLFENGVSMGPRHSGHDDVRSSGRGAYSHWGDVLYFSTSDGTDPNTNGRSYVVALPRGQVSASLR